jgi:hypothetical protein
MSENIKSIAYRDRKDSYITVTQLNNPYGPKSPPVISIGCSLKGNLEDPSWKVHVPLYMIPELIDILKNSTLSLNEIKE